MINNESSHDGIYEAIQQKLREVEVKHNVKIPYAIESGSRGWGFASPDSDYDCRFIYVHERDHYLSVYDKRDIIDYEQNEIFDVNGWDLKKAVKHIIKSNPVMHEWLSSNEVYIKNDNIARQLRELAVEFFNPLTTGHHYLGQVNKHLKYLLANDTPKIKKYFYVLRPLANIAYIRRYGTMPFMEYERTLAKLDITGDVLTVINELLSVKKVSPEGFLMPKNDTLIKFLQNEAAAAEEYLKDLKFEKSRDGALADRVFRNIIEETWK